MSVRCSEILRERGFPGESSFKGNYIPSGRQLPRTPPMTDVKKHLDFSYDDLNAGCEEPHQDTEARDKDDQGQNRTFDFSTPHTKGSDAEPDEPNSMLKGMKGYRLTADDLDFIKRMKEEKRIKKYQGDLEDVQRLLKKESMALEMEHALRKKAQVELSKFPSCEELTDWMKVVVQITAPSTDLTDLDTKSLLAMVTTENTRTAIDEKKLQLARMENMVANKRKKEAEKRGRQEKQIATEQLKIQGLMSQLSDLTSELVQQEEIYKTLQMQIKKQEEIVYTEKEDASEELQAKGRVQHGGTGRKRAGKSAEKLQDAPQQNKVKSTRSKRIDDKTDAHHVVENDHLVGKGMRETLTMAEMKPKSEATTVKTTKSVQASRGGSQKKADEPESSSHNNQAVRGRRKPGATQAIPSQPNDQHEPKTKDAQSTSRRAAPARSRGKAEATGGSAEEAQNAGLRRSRRIASRR